MSEIKSVLVVGGAGYIGSVLATTLVKSNFNVKIIDSGFFGFDEISHLLENNSIELFKGDIRNKEFLQNSIKNVDCVIHLAAIVGEPLCKKNPIAARQINFDSLKNILEICKNNGVQRFIFASTCSNYGISDGLVDENSELKSLSLYSETKVSGESLVLNFNDEKMNTTVLRFATAFGLSPRMRFDLLLQEFIRDAIVDGKIIIFGPDSWRPLVHVNDISNACIQVINAKSEQISSQIFNVGGEENNCTKLQLAQTIKDFIPNTEIEIHLIKEDPRNYRVSFQKIKNILDFQPQFSIKNGISEILNEINLGKIDPRDSEFSNMSKSTENIPIFN